MEEAVELTFEQAFQQLEDIVRQLEAGELTLDQSLELFERGMSLARLCESRLDRAEQKVSQLSGTGGDEPVPAPFHVGE